MATAAMGNSRTHGDAMAHSITPTAAAVRKLTCPSATTERLADAGIDTSVASVGDSYDNALAESIIGLFKTEVITFLGPWNPWPGSRGRPCSGSCGYNTERLHGAIGHRPPQEVEDAFYERMEALEEAA